MLCASGGTDRDRVCEKVVVGCGVGVGGRD